MSKAAGNIISRFCLLMLFAIMAFTTYAEDGNVFDRKVRIEREEGTRYELLREISDKTGYHFIYESGIINNDEHISIKTGEYTVREAIYVITGTRQIEMKVIGNHIGLSKMPEKPSVVLPTPEEVENKPRYYILTGTVFDLFSKETISSVTITLSNSSIGTITNRNGVFRLSVPDSLINEQVNISHVGYENKVFPVSDGLFKDMELSLEPKIIPLQEVVIRVINPRQVLEKMMEERLKNYSSSPSYLTAFYREGVEHKKKNVDLTEAVLKVYKTGYKRGIAVDQVKLLKMRRVLDRQERDTILTRVKSGIYSVLQLDLVKYVPEFLDFSLPIQYDYNHTDITVVNNRLVYVISFEQKRGNRDPLYRGQLYVDTENYALVEARFEINPEYVEKATNQFVEKKSRKFNLSLRKAAYTVSYRQAEDGTYFINQVRGDVEFRVRRRRHLFSSTLKVWFEMVNCKVDTVNVETIPRSERLSTRTVFSETSHPYDADFWGNFNVIVPEEDLKEFIIKNIN